MAVPNIHKLDKLVCGSPSLALSDLTGKDIQAGIQSGLARSAGHPHPNFRANLLQQPEVMFTTTDLVGLLGVCTLGGVDLGSTVLYFKLGTSTGSVARATTSHSTLTVADSVLYWTSLRLPNSGFADVSCVMCVNYDGSNVPFVATGSQALSGNLTAAPRFGCGSVWLNGVEVPGIQDITIDSGIRLIKLSASTEEWPTFIGIQETEPSVTVRTTSLVNWGTLTLRGLALDGSTGLTFFARKYTNNVAGGVARVADGTAEHIKFVGASGTAVPINSQANDTSPYTDTCRFELTAASDSVLPLVITLSSAIADPVP